MEHETKPKFKFRWYHFLLIGAALLMLLCIGSVVFLVSTPQFGRLLNGAGQSLNEQSALQKQIAEEFDIPSAQVGVNVTFHIINNSTTPKTDNILYVNLTGTTLNDLAPTEKQQRSYQIAKFAHDHFASASNVGKYCVVLIKKSLTSILTASQTDSTCFAPQELDSSTRNVL